MAMPAFLAARSKTERMGIYVLGGLILIVAAMKLLGGGDDEVIVPPGAFPGVTKTPTPSPTISPLPVTDTIFGRDPFEPLVTEGAAAPEPTGSPTSGPNSGGTSTSRRVTLLDVFRSGGNLVATVSVDGTEFTVEEGETFDTSFRLDTLTTRCGTFVFGDERFTLCIGQEVRK